MADPHHAESRGPGRIIAVIFVAIAALSIGAYFYHRSHANRFAPVASQMKVDSAPSNDAPAPMPFVPQTIGEAPQEHPRIAYVEAADLDQDGLLDAIVCDARSNTVTWIRQSPAGTFTERVLGTGIIAAAHTQTVDFDGDGDLDILVASLGSLPPNNSRIGSVIVLENVDSMSFEPRIIAEKLARVADVRGADLDGDGDLDLAVAQFGADDGETCWMENLGDWKFQLHTLQTLNGVINIEVVDMDRDGDLDLVTIASQEWEEVYLFSNDGHGQFQARLLYRAANDDYGSSGISVVDLDGDGHLDVLYTNGDAFDYTPPRPRPWHGLQWLEHLDDGTFQFHRIADVPGAYSPRALDYDGDGDLDVVVVSGFNRWEKPTAASIVLFENLGNKQFKEAGSAANPSHQISVTVGDFNGDGKPDLLSAGMHFYPPYDRLGRVTLWRNTFNR